MADLTVTAASVLADSTATIEHGKFGATITAGKVVYRDDTTKKYGLADSNGAAGTRVARGIALNGGADGQPGSIVRSGPVNIGATLTPGTAYYLSDTPGGICPLADLAAGENVVQLGIAASATILNLDIQDPGVQL